MTSAVDWLISMFRTNFPRNSKFRIRMTILCQLRDSVTPALKTPFDWTVNPLQFEILGRTLRIVAKTAGAR